MPRRRRRPPPSMRAGPGRPGARAGGRGKPPPRPSARCRGWATSPADPIRALEERLGHRFKDRDLLLRALTHLSYANEQPPALDNDGLAFLGDAVLSLLVAEHLWETAGGEPGGALPPRG